MCGHGYLKLKWDYICSLLFHFSLPHMTINSILNISHTWTIPSTGVDLLTTYWGRCSGSWHTSYQPRLHLRWPACLLPEPLHPAQTMTQTTLHFTISIHNSFPSLLYFFLSHIKTGKDHNNISLCKMYWNTPTIWSLPLIRDACPLSVDITLTLHTTPAMVVPVFIGLGALVCPPSSRPSRATFLFDKDTD